MAASIETQAQALRAEYGVLRTAYDDLRRMHQAAIQQERLHALRQMASGIAHDINNAITPITIYAQSLLENEPNLSSRARDLLQTIRQASSDVAETMGRMREFHREREPQLVLMPVQLNTLVEQVVEQTRPHWSRSPQRSGTLIRMLTDLSTELPPVMCAENEIREALSNLVLNAVEALPDGGTIAIRTTVADGIPAVADGLTHRLVYLEVTDTGIGMDQTTRRRCQEPFFTTKGERGTGLGLAMVYGTLQRHEAELEIESSPGKGSTLRLIFPASAAVPKVIPAIPTLQSAPGHYRLLVVDDDPVVLKALCQLLQSDGHTTEMANGGQAGIDAFLAALGRHQAFSMVITDLGMPSIDGRKVAAAVKLAAPSTPVVMLSGWGRQLGGEEDIPPCVDSVLGKPPRLSELREVLHHFLGREEPPPSP